MSDTDQHETTEKQSETQAPPSTGRYGDEGVVSESDTDDNATPNVHYGDEGVVAEPDTDDNANPSSPYGGDGVVSEPDTDDNGKSNAP